MTVLTERKRVRSADGTEIYYEVYGQPSTKPVLFFVHGVGGDLDAWQFVLKPLLDAGYSAVAIDLRGSGYSGHPRNLKSYTLERMNEDILSVIKAESLEKIALIGHSGGAVISLAFTLAHPETLSRLILIAPSYAPPHYARNAFMRRFYSALVNVAAILSPRAGAPWHSPYPLGKHHEEIELWGLTRTIYKNSLCSYLLICKSLMNIHFEPLLKNLRMPVLLIAAERDGIYPLAVSQTMHDKIPTSTLKIVPNANHVLPLNNPSEVVASIKEFLTVI
jgi:sigma-B regulation protein RsbQ